MTTEICDFQIEKEALAITWSCEHLSDYLVVLMRGGKIVIPTSQRSEVLQRIHSGHQGIQMQVPSRAVSFVALASRGDSETANTATRKKCRDQSQ